VTRHFSPLALGVTVTLASWKSFDRYLHEREAAALVRRDAERAAIGKDASYAPLYAETAKALERDIGRHRVFRIIVGTAIIAIVVGATSLYFTLPRWW